jgi:predicted N-acetyltransferase YhbS
VTSLPLDIRHERPTDTVTVDKLHERAFGPGRFARTAFRLREGLPVDLTHCFVASVGTLLVGSVRVSAIRAGDAQGLMLGPLTVDPAFEGRGIGAALMNRAIESARATGETLILLVGDLPYYQRFGFRAVPFGHLTLPGPVDPARFLALELVEGALAGARGQVLPPLRTP